MGERWITLDAWMVLGEGPEHVGCLQQLLETEILEDSLCQEQVKLSVEASAQMELY